MLFFIGHAIALPPAPPLRVRYRSIEPRAESVCYDSGFNVRIVEKPQSDLASVVMVIDGGSAADTEPGVAHLLEHAWFRARPDDGLAVETLRAGLEQGATTSADATTYVTVGAADDLPALLGLEQQRLSDPLVGVGAPEVASEKRIVIDELLLRGEHTGRRVSELLDDSLFPVGHPYHRKAATGEDVAALSTSDLASFADVNYRPENVTLYIESPFQVAGLKQLLHQAFPEATAGAGSDCGHPRSPKMPPAPRVAERVVEAPIRLRQVHFAWTLPASFGDDELLHRLAVGQLDRVIWSGLPWVSGLRESARVDAGCVYQPGRHAARARCMVELPDGVNADSMVKALRGALERQWSYSSSDQAWRTTITADLASAGVDELLAGADSVDADALTVRANRAHVGSERALQDDLGLLFALTPEQLGEVARQYLNAERATVLLVEPNGGATAGRGVPSKATLSFEGVPEWKPARPRLEFDESQMEGLPVVLSYRGSAPVTRSTLLRSGGLMDAPIGVDPVWQRSQVYKNLPGVSLGEIRARTGSIAWDDAGWNRASVEARAGGGSTDLALWQTRLWLDGVTIDTRSIQGAIDDRLEGLEERLARSPGAQTHARRWSHLFGEHALGTPWWREWSAARAVGDGKVLKWRRAVDQRAESTLFMVTPDPDARKNAEKYLGKWKGKKPIEVPSVELTPAPDRKIFSYAWDSLLASVSVSCRLPGRSAETDAALDVFETLVDQTLWQSLRVDGGSYAPSAGVFAISPEVSVLTMHVDVPRDQAANAVQVLLDAPGVAASADEDALKWGRLMELGENARAHASTMAHFHTVRHALAQGMTVDDVASYPRRIAQVKTADLSALSTACAGHEAVTVHGPVVPGSEEVDWRAFATQEARAVR